MSPVKDDLDSKLKKWKNDYRRWKKELVYKSQEKDQGLLPQEDPDDEKFGSDWNALGYQRTIASFFYY